MFADYVCKQDRMPTTDAQLSAQFCCASLQSVLADYLRKQDRLPTMAAQINIQSYCTSLRSMSAAYIGTRENKGCPQSHTIMLRKSADYIP